jgi:hypothetical protein
MWAFIGGLALGGLIGVGIMCLANFASEKPRKPIENETTRWKRVQKEMGVEE